MIFADIDGTMREYHLGFLPSSAKALDKAKENGHTLILCTGRSVGMIPSDVPLEKFDGMICGGGCYLSYKGEVIRNDFIDDRIMMKYRDWFDRIGAPYALETYEGMFLTPAMSEVVAKGLLRMDSPDADDAPGLRAEKIDPARRVEEFDRRGFTSARSPYALNRSSTPGSMSPMRTGSPSSPSTMPMTDVSTVRWWAGGATRGAPLFR